MTREQADAEAKRLYGERAYAFYPIGEGKGIGAISPNRLNCSILGWGKTWKDALDDSKKGRKRK